MEKTVGLGNRMDLLFHNIRIGLFWMDHSLIKANLEKATIMMEEGGKNERITIYLKNFARDFCKKNVKLPVCICIGLKKTEKYGRMGCQI